MKSSLIALGILVVSGAASALAATTGRPESVWRIADAIPPRAQLFELSEVRLGEGPFRAAMERDGAYLLSLSADRLLHGFLKNAGLPPKGPAYGGWESRGLAGHTLGHYLSACAMMFAATGDERFRERVTYIVNELASCQTPSRGGLISGFPDDAKVFAEVAAGNLRVQRFDLNGGWVPWYNLHKTFAGLRDAVVFAGNEQARAVLVRFGEWAVNTTGHLTDEQFQQMLGAEHGGMNESMADLYALTGDKAFLQLARRFCHREVLDPLARHEDRLNGLHANTQIPKVIGAARLYELTGEPAYRESARFFWDTVVNTRSWVIGGNSEAEHFFPIGDAASHLTASTAETCNTYNMLRLTEHLFAWDPTARYFDFFERALYNHILASQDPATGMCTYFVSLRAGAFKYYHDPENAFWCCTGSGMENHAKYARGIYAHAPHQLYVNLFIPSTVRWQAEGVTLTQATEFPNSPNTTLRVGTAHPVRFTLNIRVPSWIAGPIAVRVNGRAETATATPSSYLALEREWRDGDTVTLDLPMALRNEPLEPASSIQAFCYGPLVLAGEFGADGLAPDAFIKPGENDYRGVIPPIAPAMVATSVADALARIEPVAGKPLTFRTRDLVQPHDVTLIPFYRLHRERHVVYWPIFTPEAWQVEATRRTADAERERALAARTVDEIACGEQQIEANHALRSERSDLSFVVGQASRRARAGGWFEYTVAVAPNQPTEILCRWWGEDRHLSVDLLVDGAALAPATPIAESGTVVEALYTLPVDARRGQNTVTVRVQAPASGFSPRLLQLRALRPAANETSSPHLP